MLTILEKVDLLRKALMFRDIPTPGLARVAAISNEVTFVPNQILYEEDSPADSIFFMLEGEVELARSDRKTQIDGQGPLLGGLAVLVGEIHAERAIATQPTRLQSTTRGLSCTLLQQPSWPYSQPATHSCRAKLDRLAHYSGDCAARAIPTRARSW